MSPADVAALHAKACAIVASLGAVLDDVQTIGEIVSGPVQPGTDLLAVRSLLVNACESAEHLSEDAAALSVALRAHNERTTAAVGDLVKGGVH